MYFLLSSLKQGRERVKQGQKAPAPYIAHWITLQRNFASSVLGVSEILFSLCVSLCLSVSFCLTHVCSHTQMELDIYKALTLILKYLVDIWAPSNFQTGFVLEVSNGNNRGATRPNPVGPWMEGKNPVFHLSHQAALALTGKEPGELKRGHNSLPLPQPLRVRKNLLVVSVCLLD